MEDREQTFARGAIDLLDAPAIGVLLDRAVALLVERTGAREAYVEIVTDDGGLESSHVVAHGVTDDRRSEIQAIVSRGIIGEAMATGRTVETANAQVDPRFFELESVKRHVIEAVLCVPFGSEDALGAIYLQGRAKAFGAPTQDVERLARILGLAVERLLGSGRRRRKSEPGPDDAFSHVICHSAALKEVVQKLRFAAPLDVHVLLTGPSGSGKTQLAQATHGASRRRDAPFVELNCAAVPEALLENELFGAEPGAHSTVPRGGLRGKVEMAEGGTLFLDEIGDLPLLAQGKILQLLQSKTYYRLASSTPRTADIRVIAATNVQLRNAMAEKRFREDLYFRLKVLEVRVPGLSERAEDVVPLARWFLRSAVERHDLGPKQLGPAALRAIQSTEWSGNVRELAHQIEAAALNAEQRGVERVEPKDLFPVSATSDAEPEGPRTLHQAMRAFQRRHVAAVLDLTSWNMAEAARMLDVSRAHLYTIVRAHDLRR